MPVAARPEGVSGRTAPWPVLRSPRKILPVGIDPTKKVWPCPMAMPSGWKPVGRAISCGNGRAAAAVVTTSAAATQSAMRIKRLSPLLSNSYVPTRYGRSAPDGFSRSDLPGAGAQHRDAPAVSGDPNHVDVVAADHEIDVGPAAVDAVAVLVADAVQVRGAEGEMAGGVLVQQRVVEDRAQGADAAVAVDQRDFAEAIGVLH